METRLNEASFPFDFTPIGEAIKKAREAQGLTREELAFKVDKSVRHITSIENEGQLPSVDLLFQLVTMFDISLDQYVFPAKAPATSSRRRSVDSLLDSLDDRELAVIESTARSLCKLKDTAEE